MLTLLLSVIRPKCLKHQLAMEGLRAPDRFARCARRQKQRHDGQLTPPPEMRSEAEGRADGRAWGMADVAADEA